MVHPPPPPSPSSPASIARTVVIVLALLLAGAHALSMCRTVLRSVIGGWGEGGGIDGEHNDQNQHRRRGADLVSMRSVDASIERAFHFHSGGGASAAGDDGEGRDGGGAAADDESKYMRREALHSLRNQLSALQTSLLTVLNSNHNNGGDANTKEADREKTDKDEKRRSDDRSPSAAAAMRKKTEKGRPVTDASSTEGDGEADHSLSSPPRAAGAVAGGGRDTGKKKTLEAMGRRRAAYEGAEEKEEETRTQHRAAMDAIPPPSTVGGDMAALRPRNGGGTATTQQRRSRQQQEEEEQQQQQQQLRSSPLASLHSGDHPPLSCPHYDVPAVDPRPKQNAGGSEAEGNQIRRRQLFISPPRRDGDGGGGGVRGGGGGGRHNRRGGADAVGIAAIPREAIRWQPLKDDDGVKRGLPEALGCVQVPISTTTITAAAGPTSVPLDVALRHCNNNIRNFHCLLKTIDSMHLYGIGSDGDGGGVANNRRNRKHTHSSIYDSYTSQDTPIDDLEGGGGGLAGGGGGGGAARTCSDVYGYGLFKRFEKSRAPICESTTSTGGSETKKKRQNDHQQQPMSRRLPAGASSIDCRAVVAHPSHDIHTSSCVASEVSIDVSSRQSVSDGDYPWLAFGRGALAGSCADRRSSSPVKFMHCLADWMDLGYTPISPSSSSSSSSSLLQCDAYVDTPTYFITRSGDFSPFAATHDYLNTLIAFIAQHAVLEGETAANDDHNDDADGGDAPLLDANANGDADASSRSGGGGGAQIVVMDRMGMGFYAPILQLLFSRADREVLWLADLREGITHIIATTDDSDNNRHRGNSGSQPLNHRICYRNALFNIPARLSPIYNHDSCGGSTLLRLYADLVLYATGNLYLTSPPSVFVVTVIARKNYGATGHAIGRRIGNHEALVEALRSQLRLSSSVGGGGGGNDDEEDNHHDTNRQQQMPIVVNSVDYALFDYDQQVGISKATDLMVGMHGAGLVQMMFMGGGRGPSPSSSSSSSSPPSFIGMGAGGVFEFFCPEKPSANYRYGQLAKRMGLLYDSFEMSSDANIAPIEHVVPKIQQLAERVMERRRR